jgi:hypothetical protein
MVQNKPSFVNLKYGNQVERYSDQNRAKTW